MRKLYAPLVVSPNRIITLSLFLLFSLLTNAQSTTLIDPAGDGGFENGADFSSNGWTVVNGTANQWFVGNLGGVNSGTNAAFVGPNATTYGNGVTTSTSTMVHFYKDITIPAGQTSIQLSFYLKHPTVDNTFDYIYVNQGTPATTLTVGSLPTGTTTLFTNTATAYASFTPINICLNASAAGTTIRLIFTWRNDGASPYDADVVDDISLVSATPGTPVAQPTALSLNAISPSQVNGSFTAATGSPSYLVVRYPAGSTPTSPVNGSSYTVGSALGTGTIVSTSNTTTFSATGLAPSTSYDFYIYAFTPSTCAGTQYLTTSPLLGTTTTPACGGLAAGTYSVGPTGTYTTLTNAITALAAGVTGPVIFELQNTYSSGGETYPLTLPLNTCLTAVNNVTIRPAAAAASLLITSADPVATIDFNGAKYITIDGRPGGTGTTSQLFIENTVNTGVAIRLINDAQNNTIKYCDVAGQNTASPTTGTPTSAGVIYISTASSTTLQGNDNNTIANCNIHSTGGGFSTVGIFSIGTTSSINAYNDNCTITNCKIYDIFNATLASTSIKLDAGANAWTISGNSIYQSSPYNYTAAVTHRGIWVTPNTGSINNTASGFIITGNYIGGNDVNATGSAYTMSGTVAYVYDGMDISVGLGTATSIQNNTITNISYSGTTTSTTSFVGISIANGNVDCGNTTGNIIGSNTANTAINYTTASNLGGFMGIRSGAGGTLNIANNKIGGIDLNGSSASIATSFNGINIAGGTTVIISNNTIGSTDIQNSINHVTATTSTSAGVINGITVAAGTTVTVSGNMVANLNTNYMATGTQAASVRGILISSSTPAVTISNNIIRNLSSSSQTTGSGANGAIVGIAATNTNVLGCNVTGNTIDSLVLNSISSTAAVQITGIFYNTTTSVVNNLSRNFIHSFDAVNANPNILFTAIDNAVGTNTISNNMIRLGIKPDGTDFSNDNVIRGISSNSGSATNIYFNSIYIGGANVGSNTKNTYAIIRTATSGAYDVKNNILINSRSNASAGSGGKHYAIYLTTASTGFTPNYNIYQYTGNDGYFAFNGTADVNAYAAGWISGDNNSIVGNPQFIDPTGTASTVNLHIHATNPTPIESAGVNIASVTVDYDNQARAGLTPVDIGADAGNFVVLDIAPPSLVYTPLASACSTADRTLTVTITDQTGVATGGVAPKIYYKKATGSLWYPRVGTLTSGTVTNGTWDFTIVGSDMGGVNNLDVIQYYLIAQDVAGNIGSNPGGAVATNVNSVTTPPATPASYTISILGGTYQVGSSQAAPFNTLTSAIATYVTGCLTGPVVLSLIDPLYDGTTETFPIVITANASASATNTLTIKPATGNTISITGSNANSIIKFDGADYVTLNGSNGSTVNSVCPASAATRDLTITNTNTGTASAVVWLQNNSATDGATNNKVMNCIIIGNSNTTTLFGLGSGSSTIGTGSLGTGNNNNQFVNNDISKTQYGIYTQGASGANKNTGTVINQNVINAATPNNVQIGGIMAGFEDNITISANNVSGMNRSNSAFAISAGFVTSSFGATTFTGNEVTNATITNNVIGSVISTGTFSAIGIGYASSATGITLIANNMVYGVNGSSTPGDFTSGIWIGGGAGLVKVYYNSVYMNGARPGTPSSPSYALAIGNTIPSVDVRNNLLINTQTTTGTGKSYAIGLAYTSTVGNYANLTSDYNDLYTSGTSANFAKVGGLAQTAGTDKLTLTAWQTETGKDANSKNVMPTFMSSTDLHLDGTNAGNLSDIIGFATPVSVTTDIDCETRNASTPSIGADEVVPPACTGAVGGTAVATTPLLCVTGSSAITVTGFSTGTGSTYQWQSSPTGAAGTFSDISGATTPSYNTGTITTTAYYRLKVTCTSGTATDYSNNVSVAVNPNPTVTVTPAGPIVLCQPATQTLTISNTSAANASYQWKRNTTDISGETSTSYLATQSGSYTVKVTDGNTTCSVISTAVSVAINLQPTPVVVTPSSNTVCPGSSAVQLAATGGAIEATVVLGTGTTVNATTGYPSPYSNYYGGSKHQMLIRASELTGLGLQAGDSITTVAFKISSVGSSFIGSLADFQIAIGHTTSTTLTTSFVSGLQTVYGPITQAIPTTGLPQTVSHTLTTGFVWNGTDNIVIQTAYNRPAFTGGTNDNVQMFNSDPGFSSTNWYRADQSTIAAMLSAATPTASGNPRPNMDIGYMRSTNITWSPITGLYTDAAATTGYSGGITATVYAKPSATTTYTATATSLANCSNNGTVTINYNTAVSNTTTLAGTTGGSQVCGNYSIATSNNFFNNCNIIATVTPSGGTPVSGNVNACVKIDATVQTAPGGEAYVQRHFDITPATNSTTATSTIKLYFLQSEFTAYNAANGTYPDLPTNGADATGKANLRITQYNGTGTAPGNYTGVPAYINPVDANIVFNAAANRWEVTFDATGGGGFYVHTGNFVLPVTIVNFRGERVGTVNKLTWNTETEINNAGFELERSADGRSFSKIGFIATKADNGNSNVTLNYGYNDERPLSGNNYYRLKQIDKNGRFSYSSVVLLRSKATEITMSSVYPNPARDEVNLVITSPSAEKITIVVTDLSGKVVIQQLAQLVMGDNQELLKIRGLASGTYLIKAMCNTGCETAIHKFVKQ